ncbi:hypothetical protein KBY86_13145 [Synechococcus sp. Lug-A]|nr:hypothetical protein [Synechococcus sp. Lug-A]
MAFHGILELMYQPFSDSRGRFLSLFLRQQPGFAKAWGEQAWRYPDSLDSDQGHTTASERAVTHYYSSSIRLR